MSPNENVIKAAVINNYSRSNKREYSVCSELTISGGDRVADLVFCKDSLSTVYEVKAWNDDFRRLEAQVDNYRKLFDYIYVVITDNHLNLLEQIPPYAGVALYSSRTGKISYIRKAVRNNCLDRSQLLFSVPITFIQGYYPTYRRGGEDAISLRAAHQIFVQHAISRSRWTSAELKGYILHFEDIIKNTDFILLGGNG